MQTGITFLDRNASSSLIDIDQDDNDCQKFCLSNSQICDGHIDLFNPLSNLTSRDSYTFLPLRNLSSGESQNILLFPDELYCLGRSLPIFSINYLATCLCFFLSAALLHNTFPLLPYFWRRHRRKVQRQQQEEDQARISQAVDTPEGGPYGSLG